MTRLKATLSAGLAFLLAVTTVLAFHSAPSAAQADRLTEREASETGEVIQANSVTAYGSATGFGGAQSLVVAEPLTGMAASQWGDGYWLVATDGGVFTYGAVKFHGSAGSIPLNQPIVDMAATPTGNGYWLVASDGGVFTYGDARFFGSTGSMTLNQPVVSMAGTPSGNGYWLLAADGGVFSFGDAQFYGSTGSLVLNKPMVGMARTVDGEGYWMVAADGGIFSFGSAVFHGSQGDKPTSSPVVAMAAALSGKGYWLAAADGQVYPFGVDDHGSAKSSASVARPVTLDIAPAPDGGYWLAHGAVPSVAVQDRGPRVTALQNRLTQLGYWLGSVDGSYGELTRQAVYAFQKVEGLPVTGNADAVTARRLDSATRPAPASSNGDLIEIDKTRQVIFIVRGGRTLWAFNTSTGTEDPYSYEGEQYLADTPTGRFNFYHQVDAVQVGNLGRLYRPKYFHYDGIAIHGYSYVPPEPASHGCARVTNAAIDFIWANGLAPIGSEVWVYGISPV